MTIEVSMIHNHLLDGKPKDAHDRISKLNPVERRALHNMYIERHGMSLHDHLLMTHQTVPGFNIGAPYNQSAGHALLHNLYAGDLQAQGQLGLPALLSQPGDMNTQIAVTNLFSTLDNNQVHQLIQNFPGGYQGLTQQLNQWNGGPATLQPVLQRVNQIRRQRDPAAFTTG